jgi:hypothetical protein
LWQAIDPEAGCYLNNDGLDDIFLEAFHNITSLTDCREECNVHPDCLAIDYYSITMECLLFSDACETPLVTGDGASSYALPGLNAHDSFNLF